MLCNSTVHLLLMVLCLSVVLASLVSVREIGNNAINDGMLQRKESAESSLRGFFASDDSNASDKMHYEHKCKPLLHNCNSKVGRLLRKRGSCLRSVKKVKRANRHAASVNDNLLATFMATMGNLTQCYATKNALLEEIGELCAPPAGATEQDLIKFAPDRIFYFRFILNEGDLVNWEQAKAACADIGMTLAVVQSSIRASVISYMVANVDILGVPGNAITDFFYTAGNDVATEGTIAWDSSDQPPEIYPGIQDDGYNCFVLGHGGTNEQFLPCLARFSYICQVKPECAAYVTATPYP